MDDDLLGKIDTKLNALLILQVETFLRETGVARPRGRSIDKMLLDAGLSTREIGLVLGKTERAVQLVIAAGRSRKATRKEESLDIGPHD